jgi:hypothetical protein
MSSFSRSLAVRHGSSRISRDFRTIRGNGRSRKSALAAIVPPSRSVYIHAMPFELDSVESAQFKDPRRAVSRIGNTHWSGRVLRLLAMCHVHEINFRSRSIVNMRPKIFTNVNDNQGRGPVGAPGIGRGCVASSVVARELTAPLLSTRLLMICVPPPSWVI